MVLGAGAPATAPLVGGVSGGLVIRLGPGPLALELTGREVLSGQPARGVGSIGADLRWPAGPGPHVLAGFAHHHEAPLELALEAPLANVLGIQKGITHRTGFEVGAGWDGGPVYRESSLLERLRPTVQGHLIVLPATGDPVVYGVVSGGLTVALGPVSSR